MKFICKLTGVPSIAWDKKPRDVTMDTGCLKKC